MFLFSSYYVIIVLLRTSAIKVPLCLLLYVYNLFQAVTVLLASSDQNSLDVNVFLTNSAILLLHHQYRNTTSKNSVMLSMYVNVCEVRQFSSHSLLSHNQFKLKVVFWGGLLDSRFGVTWNSFFSDHKHFYIKSFIMIRTIMHWWKEYFPT